MNTPAPTKVALVTTLAVSAAAVAAFLLSSSEERMEPRWAGWFLLLFGALFAIRVAGQVLVVLLAPSWLPPMVEWNLVPYRLLLPIQLAFLVAMAWLVTDFLRGSGRATEPAVGFGRFVLALSAVYAAAMAVRYAVRMQRRPGERWFGGAIPIVFHWILAGFLFVFGTYHASY